MTLLTLLAPAAPAPPLTGEHGGVAAFEYYRVAAGVTFVAGTDAWATAELVLPVGAAVRAAVVGHAATELAPLAVARSGTTARARLTGLRGGSGYTAVTPRAAARAGVNAPGGTLRPVKGGVTARAVTATWTIGGLAWPAGSYPTGAYPVGMWSRGIAVLVRTGAPTAQGGLSGPAAGIGRVVGGVGGS